MSDSYWLMAVCCGRWISPQRLGAFVFKVRRRRKRRRRRKKRKRRKTKTRENKRKQAKQNKPSKFAKQNKPNKLSKPNSQTTESQLTTTQIPMDEGGYGVQNKVCYVAWTGQKVVLN